MIKADEEMLAIANVVNLPPLFERGSKRCSRIHLLPRLRVCAHFLKDTRNHQLISQSKLSEILVRVPVKSLLRFRCVSKTWHSLISSPAFVTTHLNHNRCKASHGEKNNQQDKFILFRHYSSFDYASEDDNGYRTYINRKEEECFALHKDDESFPHNPTLKLKPPHKTWGEYFSIVGSMNGIVCMVDWDKCVLWNVSLNKAMKTSSQTVFPSFFPVMHLLGLGCDPITNDLKLVRIFYSKENNHYVVPPLIEIFTLSTNSWREVAAPGPMYILVQSKSSPQASVSGAFHWVAHTPPGQGSCCNVIVAFDMVNEVFYEIALPSCLASKPHLNMTVVLMNGSLSLVPDNEVYGDSYYSSSVWVMIEYGVAESWTKLFDIDIGEQRVKRVITFRNNVELLLISCTDKLLSYEPYTQETRDLNFGRYLSYSDTTYNTSSYFVDTHMESLVLLNECINVPNED